MNRQTAHWRRNFLDGIPTVHLLDGLFDRQPDIVFSIKDLEGRYVEISEAAVGRCGLRRKQDAIGKTAYDLFPRPMAERYTQQDARLFSSGEPVIDSLDLTVYHDGSTGWCISNKEPLHNHHGKIAGLVCVSRDLHESDQHTLVDDAFAATVDYLHDNFRQPLRLDELAARAKMSVPQFERRMKKLFHLSPGQYLIKARIQQAARLLADSTAPIAEVAVESGFSDQSALSRQFRQLTGFTPSQYRQLAREEAARAKAALAADGQPRPVQPA